MEIHKSNAQKTQYSVVCSTLIIAPGLRIPTRNHPEDFFRVIERTDLNTNRSMYSTDLLHERGKIKVIHICAYD